MRHLFCLIMLIPAAAMAAETASEPEPLPSGVAPIEPERGALPEGLGTVVEEIEKYFAAQPAAEVLLGEALTLNVAQCVDMALAQNPKVAVADADLKAAQERVGVARSGLLPQVKGRVARTHVEFNENLGNLGIIGLIFPVDQFRGNEDTTTSQMTVTQVLFAGGRILEATKASQFLAKSQAWQRQATLETIEFDTKRAYYDCLLAQALVRVADESVVTFQRHASDAQQMLDVGLISGFELLRAQTELGARQADAVAAKNKELLTLTNLRRLLALPQQTPLRLEFKMDWLPLGESVETLTQYAYDHRAELLALNQATEAAEHDVKRATGQYLPQVAATAQYTALDGVSKFQPEGWSFTLGGEWDLYAGGRRKHEVAEAKARRSSLEHQLDDVKHLVELDVTQAYIQIQDAMAKIRSEKGTVELATEGLRLAELRFQEGVGTQSETLDAELALTNAESKLVLALHDYAVAHAALDRAIGKSRSRPAKGGEIAAGAPEP